MVNCETYLNVAERKASAFRMTTFVVAGTLVAFWIVAIVTRAPTRAVMIDQNGRRVMTLNYETAASFSEGLAAVRRGANGAMSTGVGS